jgi:hypothetical protein
METVQWWGRPRGRRYPLAGCARCEGRRWRRGRRITGDRGQSGLRGLGVLGKQREVVALLVLGEAVAGTPGDGLGGEPLGCRGLGHLGSGLLSGRAVEARALGVLQYQRLLPHDLWFRLALKCKRKTCGAHVLVH